MSEDKSSTSGSPIEIINLIEQALKKDIICIGDDKYKKCTKCLKILKVDSFEMTKSGFRKRCKACCFKTEKKCKGCGIVKPIDEFYKCYDTVKPRCKLCWDLQKKSYETEESRKKWSQYIINRRKNIEK
jgi:hypothetical protein